MTHSPTAPIAVLDSGIGGIGVLKELKKVLPHESFLYYGNTDMAPYGEKPRDVIEKAVCFHGARLLSCSKALVLACNTATAVAAAPLRAAFPDFPIIGMEPAVRPALSVAPRPRILILATHTTLREQKLNELLCRYEGAADFVKIPAPGMVRLIEAGLADSPEMFAYLKELLAPFLLPPPDAAVLGCTHFPLAKKTLSHVLGKNVPLFDGAGGTALQTKRQLSLLGLLTPKETEGEVLLTADTPHVLPTYRQLLYN